MYLVFEKYHLNHHLHIQTKGFGITPLSGTSCLERYHNLNQPRTNNSFQTGE
uniref:Uncharacterized protein n=1 Tax=Solanum lycopersicum TaxID=4081 RepID=A0A3Q7EWK9_SOLLC